MNETAAAFLLRDIRAPFDAPEEEIIRIAKTKMKRACVEAARLHFRLYKKSFDARRKAAILQVCTVLAQAEEPVSYDGAALALAGGAPFTETAPCFTHGTETAAGRPLVVGMGPAGLFCALALAEEGYAPILIDRGDDVTARAAATAAFRAGGALDSESNIQFGAGGAGTFSDGKLVTRINDPYCNYILRRLVEFGAPEEVLTRAKPHVGTDILRRVVEAMLARIASLGGTVLYRTRFEDYTVDAGGITALTANGSFRTGALVLAIGHSARDTFATLMRHDLSLQPKPFSVGVRIEHLREDIDTALYGDFAGHPALGPAEYALSDTKGERGVYTFCMCPGGEVVTAASEAGGVVVNGMSYHARDGRNSNSAVAVSVTPADVGGRIEDSISFQRSVERAAFRAGGGNYVAPVMTAGDFLAGKRGTAPTRVQPTYGGGRVRLADLHEVLPPFVTRALARGITGFERSITGFASPFAVLTGVESRTSSPVRILRGEARTAIGCPYLYPVGEGAGYAGGITSAALDGLRTALAVMERYAPGKEAL